MAQGDIFSGAGGMFDGLPDMVDTLADMHKMVQPLLSSLAETLDAIYVKVSDISQEIAKSTGKSLNPAYPRSPQPGQNVWHPAKGKIGDLFSKGASQAGGMASSVMAGVSGIMNVAGSAAKGMASSLMGKAPEGGQAAAMAVAAIISPLGSAAIVAAGALAGLTAASLSLARSFSEFSPQLAVAFAKSDIRGIARSQRVGSQTFGTTDVLLQSLDRLKDAFEPILVTLMNGINRLATWASDKITAILEFLKDIYWTVYAWRFGQDAANKDKAAADRKRFNDANQAGLFMRDIINELAKPPKGQRPPRRL